jgi:hypothetical protein
MPAMPAIMPATNQPKLLPSTQCCSKNLQQKQKEAMGANSFIEKSTGVNAKEAFNSAVEEAQYDHGHSGYTGTIAEKHEFVVIDVPHGADPEKFAEQLMDDDDQRIRDKWGPAGCVAGPNNTYWFFGWASS